MGLPVENDLLLAITSGQIIAESKFGTHKEPIVLNIYKYYYCVYKSRDMSRIIFLKILNNWQISGEFKKRNQSVFLIHIKHH